jgi:hypothetical protein
LRTWPGTPVTRSSRTHEGPRHATSPPPDVSIVCPTCARGLLDPRSTALRANFGKQKSPGGFIASGAVSFAKNDALARRRR